jgi:hypothetical protein
MGGERKMRLNSDYSVRDELIDQKAQRETEQKKRIEGNYAARGMMRVEMLSDTAG